MRKVRCFLCLLLLAAASFTVSAQKQYEYKTWPGDPLGVREYTLDNGLKVFMSVYKDAPKVQTYIAVRAGSRNDPHETTGLAHYLEHMMFKGSERLGTTDWEREKVLIQKIEDLFEAYRMFSDSTIRAAIYHKIDSLSYEASKIAVANEYDKAMTAIGSTGTNAFTSNDYTMYVENIPNNQIETWCEVQADRFQHLVLRLFHTELETIYEEKNMSLTKDSRRINETMMAALFPHHPYGNQTTLGSQEHLKNPSMRNIRNFVAQYYVPNNICISMAGDFDPDEAIRIIDKYWGSMQPREVPVLNFEREQPITGVITRTVTGLEAENTIRAYRLDNGNGSHEAMLAALLESVLNNGKCGLIDLNVNQRQRCMGAYAGTYMLNDYGAFMFGGQPLHGQTLEQVQSLFDEQIALVKQGRFDDWMLEAAVNNMKLSIMKRAESSNSRASQMAYAFVHHRSWGDVCNEINELSRVTKQELVAFANRLFQDSNYVVVNKVQGEPEPILKVAKPPITPIEVGRENESAFLRDIKSRQVKPVEPAFVDFSKDLTIRKCSDRPRTEMLYVQNKENATFNLIYRFDFGHRAGMPGKTYDLAADVLEYLGTSVHTADQLQQEFYKLACNYQVSVGSENINVSISGLSENMEKAMRLVEEIMADVQPDDTALQMLVSRILKSRQDAKHNQQRCFSALSNYGIYGADSPILDQLSEQQLKNYTCRQLCDALHNLFNHRHRVLYYGPASDDVMAKTIASIHNTPAKYLKTPANKKITPRPVSENTVYFVDYNANQTYMREHFRGDRYNTRNEAVMNIYNSYFGGSMNAIVFQEMREKRSLAYSAQSYYITPGDKDGYFINAAIIATQNDKLIDALTAFNGLFDDMPVAESNFQMAKDAEMSGIRTARTGKMGIINSYLYYERMGLDPKKNHSRTLFEAYPNVKMQDIVDFNHKYIRNQKKHYMVLGKESEMDFNALAKFGKVKKLTLEQIFGY
ncbi:MAG: peptidase M16 domain-containing protein [bacterium P3]|nr:MAG: peptidase M16 domain-containing protein [bacterium P3]KWW41476.1 MAG: peptidase M16 domain-containing protein [bacterium F083]